MRTQAALTDGFASPKVVALRAEHIQNWFQFLSGRWSLIKPTKPGIYLTKTKDCLTGFGSEAVCYLDPTTKEPKLVRSWGGYFWSEPIPDLPHPLDEENDIDNPDEAISEAEDLLKLQEIISRRGAKFIMDALGDEFWKIMNI